MFTPATIQFVTDLVGWDTPDAAAGFTLNEENLTSTSGRIFESYHALVTAANVYETMDIINASNEQINDELLKYKKQGALEALQAVFDNSPGYDPDRDYAVEVEKYKGLLQAVMGYSVAAMVLRMMINSKRINETERKSKYSLLKVELEGFRDGNGILQSRGVLSMLNEAIRKAQQIIFPDNVEIHNYDW